jgi:hypothetical protein
MPECKHEIELASCAVCTPPPGQDRFSLPGTRRPEDGWGRWLTAQHYGNCAGCDGPVEPGDQIRANGAGGWLCGSCGDAYGGPRVVRVTGGLL